MTTDPTVIHEECKVEWLDWSSTHKYPLCKFAMGCRVAIRKNTATITFRNGQTMIKRLTTKGFKFETA